MTNEENRKDTKKWLDSANTLMEARRVALLKNQDKEN